MSKTMQDKETKEKFEKFVTEECGDSLWGDDGTDDYDTAYDVKDKVWDFISQIEQEAERRGYENALRYSEGRKFDFVTSGGATGAIQNLINGLEAELKLLEEENGKQNAR